MILRELYRAIWAPFPDFGGGHCQGRVINWICLLSAYDDKTQLVITWPHGTAIFVKAGHSVNSVNVHNCFALSIDLSVEKVIKMLNKHH